MGKRFRTVKGMEIYGGICKISKYGEGEGEISDFPGSLGSRAQNLKNFS